MLGVATLSGEAASVNVVSFADERSQLLEALDAHLVAQVSDMVHRYAWLFHPETIDLAQHDIAQEVRIRFWEVAASREIAHPKAYLSKMVHNAVVDLERRSRYEATLPLPLDAHGELYQGHMIIVASQSFQDPSQQVLQEESERVNIKLLVDFIFRLPRSQRKAMLCLLNPMIGEVYEFEQILIQTAAKYSEVDLSTLDWPEEARQHRRLRSSLVVARKKLEKYLGESTSELGTATLLTGMQIYGGKERLLQEKQLYPLEKRSRLKRRSQKMQKQRQERRHQLVEALEREGVRLPELYQVVLQLHYVEERSFSEIAKQLLVSKGTVKARVHRGVQLLLNVELSSHSKRSGDQNAYCEALRPILVARCHELAEPYQTTVRLRYIDQQEYPEIAQALGVSVNTVKSRLSRARKLLQKE